MSHQTPVAMLNSMMTKLRIVPKYELVQGGQGENLFMMKVSCPIVPDGNVFSACGSFGRSKQEAKHTAAMAFLQRFCSYGNPTERIVNTEVIYKGCEMLLDICSKNKLEQPEYIDLYIGGSKQHPVWVVECKVSYISIEGQGSRKSEAREEAATRMSLILTTKGPVSEILGSANSTKPVISPKIVSCSNDPQECRDLYPASDFTQAQTETRSARRKPDIARELLRMVNGCKVAQKMKNNNDDSESNESLANV